MKWSSKHSYLNEVYKEWEKFITSGNIEGLTVRREILESWQRSYNNGVNPGQLMNPTALSDDQLQIARIANQDILEAAAPLFKELGQILDGTGQVLVLCNKDAHVLEIVGDRAGRRSAAKTNLLPGSGIGESFCGTTGTSLAVAQKMPVSILGPEHFCMGPKEYGCTAVPILNPTDGELIGILSIAGMYMVPNKHSIGFIISATRAIEGRLLEKHLWRLRALSMAYMETVLRNKADLIVAVDITGGVVDSSVRYHSLLIAQTENLQLIPQVKQGITKILSNPSLAQTQVQNIELPGGQKYSLTFNPVYRDNVLCGSLLYVYGSNSRTTKKQPAESIGQTAPLRERPNQSDIIPINSLVGVSAPFRRALELVKRTASNDATVLIQGETGVGKEGFARAIHRYNHRAQGPFIALNCGGIPSNLIASELFGYAPGAFTGALRQGNIGKIEAACGGTLFLDEIGELPLETQSYLLRVLQEKEVVRLGSHKEIPVNVRIVAATNRDLQQLISEGRFREDLFYRINVIEINVPPLRERLEDFPHLIAHFLADYQLNGVKFSDDTFNRLAAYQWPGNVRELMNVIQRAVVMGQDIEAFLLDYVNSKVGRSGASGKLEAYADLEEDSVLRILRKNGGNIAKAARELGIARTTIYRYLKKENKENLYRMFR